MTQDLTKLLEEIEATWKYKCEVELSTDDVAECCGYGCPQCMTNTPRLIAALRLTINALWCPDSHYTHPVGDPDRDYVPCGLDSCDVCHAKAQAAKILAGES